MNIDKKFLIERQGKQMVLYAGLLDAAHAAGLKAIRTRVYQPPLKENGETTIVVAEVELEDGRVFSGIGDATPTNVGRNIAPHAIRMAETRAKARALRDALNIGAVALEELGEEEEPPAARPNGPAPTPAARQVPASADPTRTADTEALRSIARSVHDRMRAINPATRVDPPAADATLMELRSWVDTWRPTVEAAEKKRAVKA